MQWGERRGDDCAAGCAGSRWRIFRTNTFMTPVTTGWEHAAHAVRGLGLHGHGPRAARRGCQPPDHSAGACVCRHGYVAMVVRFTFSGGSAPPPSNCQHLLKTCVSCCWHARAQADGFTALHICARRGHRETMRPLAAAAVQTGGKDALSVLSKVKRCGPPLFESAHSFSCAPPLCLT